MTHRTLRSRIDTWLVIVLCLSLGLMLYQSIAVYSTSPTASLINLGMLAFLLVLGRLVGYPCEYTLTPTHLLIRFGAVRQRIAYTEITAVEPSRSLWASPALSLQRVKIRYAGRFVLVSPKDRAHFIAELRQRVEVARSSVTA